MTDERLRALERRALAPGDPADREAWLAERVRAGQAPRVGLVFLEELWWGRQGHAGAAWRLGRPVAGSLLPRTLGPPPIVVAVAEDPDHVESSAAWLRAAGRCVVAATPDALQARSALPDALWFEGVSPQSVEAALAEARGLDCSTNWQWLHLATPSTEPPTWTLAPWQEVSWDQIDNVTELAPRLCAPGGRPSLLEPRRGGRLDLVSGAFETLPGLAAPPDRRQRLAATASGDGWFGADVGRALPTPGGYGVPIGADPWLRAAWTGDRCRFVWRAPTTEGLAFWCTNAHAWPRGHAKKVMSMFINDPKWVHLAPDGSTCLSVYERDVLVSPGVPLRWRDDGEQTIAERIPPGALLFEAPGLEALPGDPLRADEDARGDLARVTLGPTAELRYCVSLEAPTYRCADATATATLLGGPANEWVVYDEAHVERQRHSGRLLGGWDRWVVVLEGDLLVRIDLLTGERLPLGAPGRPFTDVIPIAGTPHVLLVQGPEAREATTAWVRVV